MESDLKSLSRLLFVVAACALALRLDAKIIYVNAAATGAESGATWEDAFTDLQAGIAAGVANDEIWVARGVYKPTDGADRNASVLLKTRLRIYGGFVGAEARRHYRNEDPHTNGCILSGDLLGDDGPDFANNAENSNNVVDGRGATDARLDGFQIVGGHADVGSDFRERGAGVVISIGDRLHLQNLWFHGNTGSFGGALYTNGSDISVGQCDFTDNFAINGGAVYLNNSDATFHSSRFVGNHATGNGGAFRTQSTPLDILNCVLLGNQADISGGVIFSRVAPDLVRLRNCTVVGNVSLGPYAIFDKSNVPFDVYNTIFYDNISDDNTQIGSDPLRTDGKNLFDTDPLFVDRDGPDNIANTLDDDLALTADSPAVDAGVDGLVPPDLFDLDKDSNLAEVTPADLAGAPRVIRGKIDIGAYEYGVPFIWRVDPSATAGANDGSSWQDAFTDLQAALSAANEFDELWVVQGVYTPTAGTDRSTTFDIGSKQLYGGFKGTETARVQRDSDPLTNRTVLSGDIGVLGDFSDNCGPVVTIPASAVCIVDGFTIAHGNANGLGGTSLAGGGIYAPLGADVTLKNLLIEECYAVAVGGGAELLQVVGTFEDCIVRRNTATQAAGFRVDGTSGRSGSFEIKTLVVSENVGESIGGGFAATGSGDLSVKDSAVFRNRCVNPDPKAIASAGGFYTQGSGTVSLANCAFIENAAQDHGGGVYSLSQLELDRCVFIGNRSENGSGVRNSIGQRSTAIRNSIFSGNSGGSAISTVGPMNIVNCSIASNAVSAENNGVVYAETNAANVVIQNSYLVLDPNAPGTAIVEAFGGEVTIASSFIKGKPGFQTITMQRVPDSGDGDWSTYDDNDYGDLRPFASSTTTDAGDNALNDSPTDFAGASRIAGSGDSPLIDIGAYEGASSKRFSVLYPALAPTADLNADGFSNFQAYAHGSTPFSDRAKLSALTLHRAGERFVFTFERRIDDSALDTHFRVSSNLKSWDSNTLELFGLESLEFTPIDAQRERVTAELPIVPENFPRYYSTEIRYPL